MKHRFGVAVASFAGVLCVGGGIYAYTTSVGARWLVPPGVPLTHNPLSASQMAFYHSQKWVVTPLPMSQSDVTQGQVIAEVKKEYSLKGLTSVNLDLVSMTNPSFGEPRKATHTDPHFNHGFQNVPVWIVTLYGEEMVPSSGGVEGNEPPPQPTVHHEIDVMVDATTGQGLGAVSFQ